jgi:predicted DNA-binding protein (UPF0251 family)
MPQMGGFLPISDTEQTYDKVTLSIDEYEAIRLIDFERLTQEECAIQMTVSRTTITSIYDMARYKMADALTNGKQLIIGGGEFKLCEHKNECCGKGCKHNCFKEDKKNCTKQYCPRYEVR